MSDCSDVFGGELDRLACDEKICLADIRKDWLGIEHALYQSKWFDYRFLNPTKATYLYAHHFREVYRRMFAKNIDTEASDFIRPIVARRASIHGATVPSDDMFDAKKPTVAGLWRGRQVADILGMPYPIYLDRALTWRLNFWQRCHLPQSFQLYKGWIVERVQADWQELQAAQLHFSTLPEYRNENYADAAIQNDHHDWLFEQLALRGNKPEVVARLIFDDQVLPEEKVRNRLGSDVFETALSYRS